MTPGEGYWVHVPADVAWLVVDSAPPNSGSHTMSADPPQPQVTIPDEDITDTSPPVPETEARGLEQNEQRFAEVSGASFMLLFISLFVVFCIRFGRRRKE